MSMNARFHRPYSNRKLKEAERSLGESDSLLVSTQDYLRASARARTLRISVEPRNLDLYKAKIPPVLLAVLKDQDIPFEVLNESTARRRFPDKREQLEAVKRWFYDDWQRIEPKLRTSIVEGISVFLSLFDDNPVVKRIFCPPAECYDSSRQRGLQIRQAIAFILLAHRERRSCVP